MMIDFLTKSHYSLYHLSVLFIIPYVSCVYYILLYNREQNFSVIQKFEFIAYISGTIRGLAG